MSKTESLSAENIANHVFEIGAGNDIHISNVIIYGSVLTDSYDPETSDIDIIIVSPDFKSEYYQRGQDYFMISNSK